MKEQLLERSAQAVGWSGAEFMSDKAARSLKLGGGHRSPRLSAHLDERAKWLASVHSGTLDTEAAKLSRQWM
jgi:hypothetical protein